MKIRFLNNIPDNCDTPFAVYQHDELLVKSPRHLDIRSIVEENAENWLDEIQKSHAQLSEKFLNYTRWWWATSASRLDARPWGHEYLLKPLFFARAVIEWINSNQGVDEIFLIGCDNLVAIYIREFKQDLILKHEKQILPFLSFLFLACRQSFRVIVKIFLEAVHIFRHYIFKDRSFIASDVLIFYELFPNISLEEGRKHYYNSLFDSFHNIKGSTAISYGCVKRSSLKVLKSETEAKEPTFFLWDNLNFSDLIICLFIHIHLIFCTWLIAFRKIPCAFGQRDSVQFWANYLFYEMGRFPCLTEICTYRALRAIFKQHRYKLVIYSYEEKGIERAILFACQERNIPAIGYSAHPEHQFALALRDIHKPFSPEPLRHAVCGSAYIDFFGSWCGKDPGSISVWGSAKSPKEIYKIDSIPHNHLKILMLLSHPNELKVFYSWLRAEERLSRNVTYLLRIYKAQSRNFLDVSASLRRDFNCVQETHGDLAEDLSHCDLAVFCGTSAGVVAVNYGRLVTYLFLNDFFQEHPCFSELDAMLACKTPAEFCKRLDEIRAIDADSIAELYRRQRAVAKGIFSPIQSETIEADILRYTG